MHGDDLLGDVVKEMREREREKGERENENDREIMHCISFSNFTQHLEMA